MPAAMEIRGWHRPAYAAFLAVAFGLAAVTVLLAAPGSEAAFTARGPIVIVGNADFTPGNGVTGGSGTAMDPFIIEGWEIDGSANSGIEVYNTDAHFVIRDVYIHSSLIDAIYFYSVRNGRVENATVTGNDGALYIEVSSHVTVASNNISFNGLDAVVLDWSSNITLEGNAMWSNGDWGVFAYESDDLAIRGNTISGNGWAGIELDWSDRVRVEGNVVANNNVAGLIAVSASNVTIVDNVFPDNDFNVDLTDSFDILVRGNTVATSTSDGITITGGARLTIEENNITGNGGGVLAVGTTALFVRHNAFWGNIPQAADDAGANAWDDGYPSGGNYWSDYTGVDNCSGPNQNDCPLPDGIGDTPYVIEADSQDRYPLMQPYSGLSLIAAPLEVPVVPPYQNNLLGGPEPLPREFDEPPAAWETPGSGPKSTPRGPISINGNSGFTTENGVTGGSGTASDPYRIEGWEIDASLADGIAIMNTNAYLEIRSVFVHSGGWTYNGILLDTVANVLVDNVRLDGNGNGITVYGSTAVRVANSRVTNSLWEGILVDSSSFVTVEGNAAESNAVWGIDGWLSTDLDFRDNTASNGSTGGIQIANVYRAAVTGNNASGNGLVGMYLDFADDVEIVGNALWNNDYGLDMLDAQRVVVRGNAFGNSASDAVSLSHVANVTFLENVVAGSAGGLVAQFATDLAVFHNAFANNGLQGYDESGTRTAWDADYPAGGNYWSDYAGVDNCSGPNQDVCTGGDGIGDTPYVINPDTMDRYPLTEPYSVPTATAAQTDAPVVPPFQNNLLGNPAPRPSGFDEPPTVREMFVSGPASRSELGP